MSVAMKLRGEEEWARRMVSTALDAEVTCHDDGSRPGMYDLDIGDFGAVEVTAAIEPDAHTLWKLINDRDHRWIDPRIQGAWIVHLVPTARAKEVERDLPALLHHWQQFGVDHYRDPEWASAARDAEAFALGVTSAHRGDDTSFPGTIYPLIELPLEQVGGIVADSGDGLVEWAIPWIGDPVRSDNLDKLRRSGKPQRHLFVFIPPWTTAPWPAVDVLLRHDSPPLPTTSPVLPEPLTHLWFASGWSVPYGLRWAPDVGWARFSTLQASRDA